MCCSDIKQKFCDYYRQPQNVYSFKQFCDLTNEKIIEAELLIDLLQSVLASKVTKIFDVGCGIGGLTIELLRRWRPSTDELIIDYLDPSLSMLQTYKNNMIKEGMGVFLNRQINLKWEEYCSSDQFLFNEYDLIIADHCLYGMNLKKEYFICFKKSLSMNGICVITISEKSSDLRYVKYKLTKINCPNEEVSNNSAEDIEDYLIKASITPKTYKLTALLDVSTIVREKTDIIEDILLTSWLMYKDKNHIQDQDIIKSRKIIQKKAKINKDQYFLQHPIKVFMFNSISNKDVVNKQ